MKIRTRPHVLIVEDEPDLLVVMRVILESAGFETSLAAEGATAIHRIAEERPDLVVLDLMLPVVDGWAVLADILARADAPPVLVCSARRSERDLARAEEMGAAGFVTKPFDPDELIAVARTALGRGGPRSEANPKPVWLHQLGPA